MNTDMMRDAEEKQRVYAEKRRAWQVGVDAKEAARKAAQVEREKMEDEAK